MEIVLQIIFSSSLFANIDNVVRTQQPLDLVHSVAQPRPRYCNKVSVAKPIKTELDHVVQIFNEDCVVDFFFFVFTTLPYR